MGFFDNTRKPERLGGKLAVAMMNSGHAGMAEWGFAQISPRRTADALDIGCGGGANLGRLGVLCGEGTVTGIDHSEVSVAASEKKNRQLLAQGRCSIVLGDVSALPFADASFDLATAFETVYFWPDLEGAFRQTARVLRPGGIFMICNELDGTGASGKKWEQKIAGMKVYTAEALEEHLRHAGFGRIKTVRHPRKPWLCLIARKE